jgi:selenide,water dikinase
MPKRLTEYADCAGCASKLDASLLAQLTSDLPLQDDPRVLVDFRTADDAGVYRWTAGRRWCRPSIFPRPSLMTYDFDHCRRERDERRAAMGGQPHTALAITALPKAGPPADVIREVFRGGADLLKAAGGAARRTHGDRSKSSSATQLRADRSRTHPDERRRALAMCSSDQPSAPASSFARGASATAAMSSSAPGGVDETAERHGRRGARPARDVSACTDVTGFGRPATPARWRRPAA